MLGPSLRAISAATKEKKSPPGGTTFDFKRVHFLTLFETRFFCTGVQNWTLSRLNPVPPWRSGFKPTHAPSSAALFQYRNTSTSHKPTSSWQWGPRTREAPTRNSSTHPIHKQWQGVDRWHTHGWSSWAPVGTCPTTTHVRAVTLLVHLAWPVAPGQNHHQPGHSKSMGIKDGKTFLCGWVRSAPRWPAHCRTNLWSTERFKNSERRPYWPRTPGNWIFLWMASSTPNACQARTRNQITPKRTDVLRSRRR